MEFFFPEDNLQRTVPEETQITSLHVEPYPEGTRIHVDIEMTPFQKRPYLEVTLFNGNGEEIASTTIIEPMTFKIDFTMHLRGEHKNPYTVEAKLFYPDGPSAQPQTCSLDINPLPSDDKPFDPTQGKPASA